MHAASRRTAEQAQAQTVGAAFLRRDANATLRARRATHLARTEELAAHGSQGVGVRSQARQREVHVRDVRLLQPHAQLVVREQLRVRPCQILPLPI